MKTSQIQASKDFSFLFAYPLPKRIKNIMIDLWKTSNITQAIKEDEYDENQIQL